MKKPKIFNKTYIYSFVFEIEYDINVTRELIIKIKEPQILYPDSINPLSIYISRDYHHIADGCIRWIYEQNKERLNEKCLCDCLLKCAVEDKEWTRKVNEDFTEIQRRKITFLPEIQDAVCDKLNGYLTILETMHTEMMKEKQKEKEDTEKRRNKWKVTRVFTYIRPKGGEYGTNGYIDAEYMSQNKETVRMVSRDIFDGGCYYYPKRLERKGDVSDLNEWTEPEKQLGIWLDEFGEFHGIRM